MSAKIKHVIKIILIFALIICWAKSLGYANLIKSEVKTINFFFENTEVPLSKVEELRKQKQEVAIVGWKETSLETIINPNLNRRADNIKILFVQGRTSLLIKTASIFEDDKDGCLIDKDTAYKLFGSLNAIGNKINYKDRILTVRGIHSDTKANVVMQFEEGKAIALDGITIDSTKLSNNEIKKYKLLSGFSEMPIEGGIYANIAKVISLLFPIVALFLIIIKIITQAIKVKNKPIFLLIYLLSIILTALVFLKMLDISIKIPLDMIPNKWSDFEFWSKLWEEYTDKLQYVFYMKKYGVDIYNIENLLMTAVYSILAIVLFIINIFIIKVKEIKELILVSLIAVISSFIVVILVYYQNGFDINIVMIWGAYPLYFLAQEITKYFEKINIV